MAGKTRTYKKQIFALRQSGKSVTEIAIEYNIAKSTVCMWVDDFNHTGSFKRNDNRSEEDNERIRLRKEIDNW